MPSSSKEKSWSAHITTERSARYGSLKQQIWKLNHFKIQLVYTQWKTKSFSVCVKNWGFPPGNQSAEVVSAATTVIHCGKLSKNKARMQAYEAGKATLYCTKWSWWLDLTDFQKAREDFTILVNESEKGKFHFISTESLCAFPPYFCLWYGSNNK